MNIEQIKTYPEMREDFLLEKITAKDWDQFVYITLEKILEENKDVLARLKDR
jgi:hypothetical protein